jgi:hypothetical protein
MHISGNWGSIWTTYFQVNAERVPKIIAVLLLFHYIIHYHAFILLNTVTDGMVNLTPNFLVSQQQGTWREMLNLIKKRGTWTQICVCSNKDKNYHSCYLLKLNFAFQVSHYNLFWDGWTNRPDSANYGVYTQTLVKCVLLNHLYCLPYKCTVSI